MFDLFRSREKSTRYLLSALLMLIAISMVITLIPGVGSGGTGPTDQVIAEIGPEKLTMREVQVGLQDTLKGRQIPPELVAIYAPQIVNQIVAERAVAYYANQMGYKVTDEDVAQVIQLMVPQLFEGGKFVGKETYTQFLAANNTSIEEFERQARMRAGLRRIQGMILEGMVVTPEEIEREYRARNEKIALEYVKLDPAKLQQEIKPTQEEINVHWNTSKVNYKLPEKRGYKLLVADEEKIGASMKLSDDQLRQFYEANKDQFRTPERVKVRHILVKTMEKPKDQEEALKKKAEDLLKQIKAGADFAELARKNSDDTVSAAKGGDLDWVARGQTVKPFEEAAFSLKPKELSGLVKSEFGFHIIQPMEKEAARLKPFEEVKDSIQKDRLKQQVYDRMQTATDQARAAAVRNPEKAEEIANQFGLSYVKVEKAGKGDPIPLLGQVPEFDENLFELKAKGEVTPVLQTQDNKLGFAILDEIFPPRQAELAEVESQVRQVIVSERAQALLASRSKEFMDKLRANNNDLRKTAAAMKLEVKTAPEFSRDGSAEGIGPANYLEEGFRREVGAVFGPVNVNGSIIVARVSSKTPADMAKLNEQRYDLLIRLKGKKAQERRELFEDGLIQQLKASGKVKIHADALKRLVDSYKSS